jgi:GDP-L-fucose synthase
MANIFVAGHRGMVGSAICKQLVNTNNSIVTASREELDLLDQKQVRNFFEDNRFDQVYVAAAKVGGIHANNTYPAEFIYQNLMIEANIIDAAHQNDVQKLLFLGSSCIYPKYAAQPMSEGVLLTGVLEATNEPYAIAKIAGIKLCESYNRQYGRDYRSVMPTNLYGPGDNFHPENSHVIPALMKRFHEAKVTGVASVSAWGTGSPLREFLHVSDMAAASIFVMNLDILRYKAATLETVSHINVGAGVECSIKQLTETIAKVVGYSGTIIWDSSKPNGSPRKLMDSSKLEKFGWKSSVQLEEGLQHTYRWYLENLDVYRQS